MSFVMSHMAIFALVFFSLLLWILVRVTGVKDSQLITDGNAQSYIVHFPKKLIGISVIIMLVGIGVIAYMDISMGDSDKTVTNITDMLLAIIFIGVFAHIMLKVYRYRVVVNIETGITVYPLLGSSYTFTTADIVSVNRKLNSILNSTESYVIKINTGKKFRVVNTMISYNQFQKLLYENCGTMIR